jgi:protease-4
MTATRWFLLTVSLVALTTFLACGRRETRDLTPKVLDVRLGAERSVALPVPFAGFATPSPSLVRLLGTLKRAREDKSVRGVLLRVGGMPFPRAVAQEMAAEIAELRKAGKKTVAVADAYTTDEYALAAACDRVLCSPGGSVDLLGLTAEVYFYKDLFDKLGIEADIVRVGEYKSAVEPYTRNALSPEAKAMLERVLDVLYEQLIATIASGRRRAPEQVRAWIDGGPFAASDALKAGLLDRLLYADELDAYLDELVGEDVRLVDASERPSRSRYEGFPGFLRLWAELSAKGRRPRSHRDKIALIHVDGMIVSGHVSDPFGGGYASSGAVVEALNDAATDATVKAIVLRVESPGGSALAADLIWRSVRQATRKKPVVVSMGGLAASGGYYVAAAGDYILAEPATLTGSIGVFGGKFSFGGLYSKIGVRKEVLRRGRNAAFDDEREGYSDSERARATALVNDTYSRFVRLVADGRKMKPEAVEAVARGQVWTGAQAARNGLVDELGGLRRAFEVAKERAGYPKEALFDLLELPEPASFLDLIVSDDDSGASVGERLRVGLYEAFEPLGRERVFALSPFRVVVK